MSRASPGQTGTTDPITLACKSVERLNAAAPELLALVRRVAGDAAQYQGAGNCDCTACDARRLLAKIGDAS